MTSERKSTRNAARRWRALVRAPRRGYVFLTVLMLLVIAGIVISVALRRAGMQAVVVEDQLDSYRRYHELQGARAITDVWLLRNDAAKLKESANTGEAVATQLVDETVYRIYVQDGQGTVLSNLLGQKGSVPQTWLVEMLTRLPRGREDLTRAVGPWQLSLRSAPDEVIEAMAAADPAISTALRISRDDQLESVAEVLAELDRAGVNGLTAQAVVRNLTFDPTLWRIDVEAERPPDPIRRYVLLVEKARNIPRMLEWRVLQRGETVMGFGPGGGRPDNAVRGPKRPRTPKTEER